MEEGGASVHAAMNEITRDEFDNLHTLLNEVKAQQQLHGSVNLLIPVLKSALQSFSLTQANQVVYAELAKTPIFRGDGVLSIDSWLDGVVNVLKQCSVAPELQPTLLISRLDGKASQFVVTLSAETKADLELLCSALRNKFRTASDTIAAIAGRCTP
ncbi:MAG: hypothetical protein GY820_38120 [Gammaproteobacteria bacterium]|nr:hypothetical protein [Gammaproteobacteria bacterium]